MSKISIPRPFYSPTIGSLAILCRKPKTKNIFNEASWHGCREMFHDDLVYGESFDKCGYLTSQFAFRIPNGFPIARIRAFFKEVESRLKIKSFSKFFETNQAGCILVVPARWWNMHHLRLGLFTIFLRSASQYTLGRPFEDALYSYSYAADTQDAIKKFFKGYVHFGNGTHDYGNGNWRDLFDEGRNLKVLRNKKLKSRRKKKQKI